MFYTPEQIEKGIVNFIDNEFMSQYPADGIEKALIGTGLAIIIKKRKNQALSIIKKIGVVDDDGTIDLDLLSEELKKHIPDSGLVYENNFLGKLTFSKSDIDKLCEYIKK